MCKDIAKLRRMIIVLSEMPTVKRELNNFIHRRISDED
jgi:hypothetical protein